jgi:hypothetical protein
MCSHWLAPFSCGERPIQDRRKLCVHETARAALIASLALTLIAGGADIIDGPLYCFEVLDSLRGDCSQDSNAATYCWRLTASAFHIARDILPTDAALGFLQVGPFDSPTVNLAKFAAPSCAPSAPPASMARAVLQRRAARLDNAIPWRRDVDSGHATHLGAGDIRHANLGYDDR